MLLMICFGFGQLHGYQHPKHSQQQQQQQQQQQPQSRQEIVNSSNIFL
jgi:hypothetical protein